MKKIIIFLLSMNSAFLSATFFSAFEKNGKKFFHEYFEKKAEKSFLSEGRTVKDLRSMYYHTPSPISYLWSLVNEYRYFFALECYIAKEIRKYKNSEIEDIECGDQLKIYQDVLKDIKIKMDVLDDFLLNINQLESYKRDIKLWFFDSIYNREPYDV